jgi:hypothetical protein
VPSFAAIAGVAGVLTAGLIRANLQSHLALARVGEQPHSSTPTLLPVWTIFDSDVERRDETPAFLGEQKYDLAGAVGSAGGASTRTALPTEHQIPPAAASNRACGSLAHGSPTFFTAGIRLISLARLGGAWARRRFHRG